MATQICFATHNKNKLSEVSDMLYRQYSLVGLAEIGCTEEIPETGATLEENSKIKAEYVWKNFHCDCFADDTGLEVDALGGDPGVRSARYAGTDRDNGANMELLLDRLKNNSNRKARFRTIITLFLRGQMHQFEGIVDGKIGKELKGTGGFGYDPIFIPDGYDVTFAEMNPDAKNAISHRGRAIEKLVRFLKSQ